MRKKKPLHEIDFDRYEFNAEKGLIWSKYLKRWLTGRKQHVKNPKDDDDYYLVVELKKKNGSQDFYQYHRVIGYLFCDRPEYLKDTPYEEIEINHINENKHDNRAVNLEWCDRAYNINFGTASIRRSETNKKIPHTKEWNEKVSKAQAKKEVVRVMDNGDVLFYESIAAAAKAVNGCIGAICQCCHNKFHKETGRNYKSFRRYKLSEWYFKEEYENIT